jgi:sugar lactone lactonase YvrE
MPERDISVFGPPGHFYECPRWREGRWWVSDMRGGTVYSFSPEGEVRVEVKIDDRPGGLGWTADGKLLVVSMEAKTLLRIAAGGGVEAAVDVSSLVADVEGFCNDMAVDAKGNAYVGFDSDFNRYGREAELGRIIHVPPDGSPRVAARDLAFPNGIMFAPGGRTLMVAETTKQRLSGFAIASDGSLGTRTLWGSLDPLKDERAPGGPPLGERRRSLDGCAMDAEGYVWAADLNSACLRVAPGGAVVDAVFLPEPLLPFACALGGPDGRTLMICGADHNFADRTKLRESRLFTTRVEVAGV